MSLRGRIPRQECIRLIQILLTCWFCFKPVTGDCAYEGQRYRKGSIWRPTPCAMCSCDDPVALCENIVCSDPHCDYTAGQQLQRADNSCCPECHLRHRPCQFQGQSVQDSTSWSPAPCVSCVCDDGEVTCANVTCPMQHCKPGQLQQILPGHCCPRCIPAWASCTDDDGVRRQEGSEWSPLPCVLCVCRSGQVKCLPLQCPQPDCPLEDMVPPSAGECCMTCRRQTCVSGKHVYQEGDRWIPDPCTNCVCHQGVVHCRKQNCSSGVLCGQGESSVTLPGQCCPKCVRSAGACDLELARRYHGDIWNISNCEFCMCSSGKVQCRTLACRHKKCKQGEMLFTSDGKCCAECVPIPVCEHKGSIFQEGDTWDSNLCTVCTCSKGKTTCYHTVCPTCPEGSAPRVNSGRCCGECEQGNEDSNVTQLSVRILPSSSLRLIVNKPLQAVLGSRTTLSRDTLDMHSNVQESVRVHVISGPKYGDFWHHGKRKKVTVFGLSDLHEEEVMYGHHGDVSAPADMAVLLVADSYHQISIVLEIKLQHKNSMMPVVLANAGGHVWPGELLPISRDHLEITAVDFAASNIVYTLVPTVNNPKKGEIMMVVPAFDVEADSGWKVIGNGVLGVKTFRFLQRDINEGRIFYRHLGPHQEDSDFFTFEVSDMASPPNVLHNQTFQIQVLQGVRDDTSALSLPSPSPGLHFGMTVFENQVVPITSANLPHRSLGTPDHELAYRLTSLLADDEGIVEHIDYPYVPVLQFTQADVNSNRIIYRPPDEELGQEAKDVSFTFILTDGKDGRQPPEQTFTIRIIPVNNMPPRFLHPNPEVTVAQGDTTQLASDLLAVADSDTLPENLTVTLVVEPAAGSLEKVDDPSVLRVLRAGDTFPYSELLTNTFQYHHSGKADLQKDHIRFSVSDGTFQALTTVTVHIFRVDKSAPELVPSSLLVINVTEGGATIIARSHLAFHDGDAADDDVSIILIIEPAHGYLLNEKEGRPVAQGNNFTQADINNGQISYVAVGEIGSEVLREILHFKVSDASNNILPGQALTVHITPLDNQPPVVNTGSPVQVEEGGEVQITGAVLGVVDADTSTADLFIVVSAPASFGSLQNKRTDSALRQAEPGDADQFPVTDILNGYVFYIQSDHLSKEPEADALLFYATDGLNKSPVSELNIHITLINDEPPALTTKQLFLKEGQAATLSNASVNVVDLDTKLQDLILTLGLPPSSGTLKKKKSAQALVLDALEIKPNDTFTYQDLLDGLIVYEHNDEETTTDMLTLDVTDGNFSDTNHLDIIIELIHDETPRVTVNKGLTVRAGSKTTITSSDLRATDVDSEDAAIVYTLTKNPTAGSLQYQNTAGQKYPITVGGSHSIFTQQDIDRGHIEYVHEAGKMTGTLLFKFKLSDTEGHNLIDQDFFITVIEDRFPPKEIANKEFVLKEGERKKITTDFLSFTDVDSQPGALAYRVLQGPHEGHVELTTKPGIPVVQFTQADLASGSVFYVHTSSEEIYTDNFVFSVTDGTNELVQTFHITFIPVDDAIPSVINNGLRVQEGARKLLTEFDLRAVDLDTQEEKVVFTIIEAPVHGTLDMETTNKKYIQATQFSMADIYESRISYQHNGNEMFRDAFTFTVSDGTNSVFTIWTNLSSGLSQSKPLSSPQEFLIEVIPVDDEMPVLQVNLGLEFLEQFGSVGGNYITEHDLKAVDEDSLPQDIVFIVSVAPSYGIIENTDQPGQQASRFTQEDINRGKIRYKIIEKTPDLQDRFHFDLTDRKPNVVADNIFHIRWSQISFTQSFINVSETAGFIQVPITRTGNLKQYSVVKCHTKPGSAVSKPETAQPGMFDFVQFSGQVQFDSWQETKTCSIIINDDSVFEGPESFSVELSSPSYALLGDITSASIIVFDPEDVTLIEFEKEVIRVNETDKHVIATVKRKGDLSITVTVLCSTFPVTATGSSLTGLESGSDYISRGTSDVFRVVFTPGIASATCDVKLLDDSDYESEEQFELKLLDPSVPAALGRISTSIIIIEGPNDESRLFLSASEYHFAEDDGVVEVEVLREGSDLDHISSVWCATRLSNPASASPGVDYVPSSMHITFSPGQVSQKCHLTILDDDFNPRLEGNETFEVFLSLGTGGSLANPYHSVVFIEDETLDMPWFTFTQDIYTVDEKNQTINASVLRLGDLTLSASVICYTRQQTARAMVDYTERTFDNISRIFFKPGEREKNCSVEIEDDTDFELEEDFFIKLADPQSSATFEAQLGQMDTVRVIITNHDDVPRLQFDHEAYSVHEPSVKQQIANIVVRIIRTGADNMTASVRCSTRDGSAMSGLDYNARSLMLTFPPGIREVDFPIDILYNSDIEWHETFTVVLGPENPQGAMFGSITMTTITILDNEVSGSLVLPAQPVVVSLLHYDDAEQGAKVEPSAGYPVVCINPCNIHHPNHSVTHTLCEKSGVNTSAIAYQWEVAAPHDLDGSTSPFILLSDSTLFASTNHMVLDSIYFRPHFRVRCLAQPLHANGNPGIPLRSQPRIIGHTNAICKSPSFGGQVEGYHAQSFLASLSYVPPHAGRHANTINIRVEVPHQDGMLPLLSTFPLHNVRYLLLEPVYRQQHVCSNFITAAEHGPVIGKGFLGEATSEDEQHPFGPGYDFPYQFDNELREEKTLLLYRHLNLKQCLWTFEAWYHMTELVDICGGHILSDFQVKDKKKTHLTARVPLHVSYLFAMAPVGWSSLEHFTDMEFAFYYDTVLWKSGLETEGRHGGKLQIKRVLIRQDGKLVIEFHTQAKFRGQFVLSHQTMPGFESRILAPKSLAISFDLQLMWSQPTFDSPHQIWQATSRFNLKDYTGIYMIEIIPCSVTPTQAYVQTNPLPCTAQHPQRFEVPLSFQQTNRPVPVVYTLDTQLQLTNILKMLLQNPSTDTTLPEDWDFNGAFSKGQSIYGRVLWNPSQDLKSAYRLSIEKVYLCTGSNGYIPTYDPSGEIYREGPQYGCLQPSSRLLYRFLILDRENPDIVQADLQDIPFHAMFASGAQELSPLLDMPGVDGFVFNVDPLYKVDSGHQWYLQVVYFITPDTPYHRHRRAAVTGQTTVSLISNKKPHYNPAHDMKRNGTNIQCIMLEQEPPQSPSISPLFAILPATFFLGLICTVIASVLCVQKRKRKMLTLESVPVKRNNLVLSRPSLGVSVTSLASSVSKQNLNRLSSGTDKTINLAAKQNLIKAKDVNVNLNPYCGTEV